MKCHVQLCSIMFCSVLYVCTAYKFDLIEHAYPPVIKHGWPENPPFMDDALIETSIDRGFSLAMFDYQRENPKDTRVI